MGAVMRSPGVFLSSDAMGPPKRYATSTSPVFSAAARVLSSGMLRITMRLTDGAFFQYSGNASSTSSTPGLNETNLYGPAPIGALRNPSSPTFSTYFFGTIQPAPVAEVP